ncbi:MAG: FAD-dependent oxidoreductase [Ornithinimicrobium sp.]|uniref:dihydrolipoyl dehydrogenase family protein n=1 Tax=Ornithinimicrobium sp. TaxID=1977084 RepID=UPI0026DEC5C9|nr:FAD-dependent oxidoreductase [Ornithinimicrobium sp.]MDO5740206.1 FAD-dependent oxidoreductase [Ornithinimicrobium sp.]
MSAESWDLLVLGGGSAGIVAAKTAARLGARVVLVEQHRTGGDCLWTGCVPSKALIAAAEAAASARQSGRFGVIVQEVKVDFTTVMEHVHTAIGRIAPIDSHEALEEAGVRVRSGHANFVEDGAVDVDGERIAFRQAIVATGASPALPPIPGLSDLDALTSDTVWDLIEAPRRLAVLGGGSIGCELGQAFSRLGSAVTIVEGEDRILPREDTDAAAAVRLVLETEGVRLRVGQDVTAVEPAEPGGRSGRLRLGDGIAVEFDQLLVAVGRTPTTSELGFDRVGVQVSPRGFVVVDKHLRTTNPRIWAAGDLTGHPQFTHMAGNHGSLAASNAVLGLRRAVDLTAVPRVTYTRPEVAAVGVDTDRERDGVRIITQAHAHVDRAVAEQETGGFTKLAVDRRGRILGATIVGPRAGESLGEVVLAVQRGLSTRDLSGVIHAYPTWNDGLWNAALADVREQLDRPSTQRVLGTLAKGRRWWLERRAG